MLIFFTKKHYGKDTSEVPSSLRIWIIESYDKADWTLIQECKKELSERLKLDFVPPQPPPGTDHLLKQLKAADNKIDMMAKFLHIFGVDYHDTDKYYKYPSLLEQDWNERIKQGNIILPKHFIRSDFYKEYMKRFREENKQYYKQVEK